MARNRHARLDIRTDIEVVPARKAVADGETRRRSRAHLHPVHVQPHGAAVIDPRHLVPVAVPDAGTRIGRFDENSPAVEDVESEGGC